MNTTPGKVGDGLDKENCAMSFRPHDFGRNYELQHCAACGIDGDSPAPHGPTRCPGPKPATAEPREWQGYSQAQIEPLPVTPPNQAMLDWLESGFKALADVEATTGIRDAEFETAHYDAILLAARQRRRRRLDGFERMDRELDEHFRDDHDGAEALSRAMSLPITFTPSVGMRHP